MRLIRPHGGYGLGNDLIPWAKAWILSQELGAHCLAPAWGNNPRGYGQLFNASPFNGELHRVYCKLLPHFQFTEEDYRALGASDFREAAALFAEKHGLSSKRSYIVSITGLWGAFSGLESARNFLLSELLKTRHTQSNLYKIKRRLTPGRFLVGLHVRKGDFAPPFSWSYRGAVNMSWPDSWYVGIAEQIYGILGQENVEFLLCSNGSEQDLSAYNVIPNLHFISRMPCSDVSDLLSLSACDLLLPSMSTFSFWASFFSSSLNIWMKENLVPFSDSLYKCPFLDSLTDDHSQESCQGGAFDAASISSYAVGLNEKLPDDLIHQMNALLNRKRSKVSLLSSHLAFG